MHNTHKLKFPVFDSYTQTRTQFKCYFDCFTSHRFVKLFQTYYINSYGTTHSLFRFD